MAISLAAGLASSGMAMAQQKKANDQIRSQQGILDQQRAFNEQIFNKQYYQDIVNRTEISDMLRKLGDRQDLENKRDNAQSAIMGATAEQQIAQNAARGKNYSEAVASIASNASTLKDAYLSNWQNSMNNYFAGRLGMSDKIAGINSNAANQWSKTASGFYDIGSNFAEDAVGEWKYGGNKKAPTTTTEENTTYYGFGDPHANETWG